MIADTRDVSTFERAMMIKHLEKLKGKGQVLRQGELYRLTKQNPSDRAGL